MSDNKKATGIITMPALAMRDIVLFPHMVIHFDVVRKRSVNSIKAAMAEDRKIFLTAQKDLSIENPTQKDVYTVGVVAEIKQVIKTSENATRILVEGLYMAKLGAMFEINDGELYAEIKRIPSSKAIGSEIETTAIMRSVKEAFSEYAEVIPRMPKELYANVNGSKNPYALFESIIFNLHLMVEDKQRLLETKGILKRLELLYEILVKETQVLSIENRIHASVAMQMDKNQRDYYLREQMKVIANQLGEGNESGDESFAYMSYIYDLDLDDESTDKLIAEATRLSRMPQNSQEGAVIRTYLDTALALPWNNYSKEKNDIVKAQKVLDRDHYGLKNVKERVLETLAVKQLAPEVKGQIVCFVGPPGVGKTSIGKSIAKATGRKYVRVSLGGVRDESDIRGHRKTYVGAMPGRIINALKEAGTKNPVILLDEIDKMANDFRGDPSSALLEVLDSEQNTAFRDHYLEIPFDLSDVLFVTTANSTSTIAAPLLDRMDLIELTSYTREEKFNIAKKHLIAKQLKKNGLKATQFKIQDSGIYAIIDFYTREAGVRTLERIIAKLCRKAAKEIVSGSVKKVTFTDKNLDKYLGARKYLADIASEKDEVGVVNGLAWTSVGGVLMPLEVLVLDGKGTVEITGSLGDVMRESAKIAVSYTRSVADKYGIEKDFNTKKDLHIHAPEGAVPKDGPSAGVALVTSLVSALSKIPIRKDVAMTGEITLHGKVLPIGGLREKTMAAYKAGIKTVVIPFDNKADIDEVDDVIKSSIHFVYAKTLDEVLSTALVNQSEEKSEELPPVILKKNKEQPSICS